MKRQNSKSLGIDVLAAGVRSISGMQTEGSQRTNRLSGAGKKKKRRRSGGWPSELQCPGAAV
jgi:hypothetical protein